MLVTVSMVVSAAVWYSTVVSCVQCLPGSLRGKCRIRYMRGIKVERRSSWSLEEPGRSSQDISGYGGKRIED
jgi:hypothetical protein